MVYHERLPIPEAYEKQQRAASFLPPEPTPKKKKKKRKNKNKK